MNSSKLWLRRCMFSLALVAATPAALAADLGTIGPVYEIEEEDALAYIMRQLRAKEESGDLRAMQEAAVERSLRSIKHPAPVQGVTWVAERSSRLVDPTVVYPKEIRTEDGRLVVPAGAKVNPLVIMSLTKRLVFFDGRDPDQLEAVRQMVALEGKKVKPIMVGGSWLEATRAWGTQVYYDQKGVLTARFGIKAVPTVIRQDGQMLRLEEIPAKELK